MIAVYNANNGYVKDLANKATRVIKGINTSQPTEQKHPKEKKAAKPKIPFSVKAKDEDSMISKLTVNLINKVLDNPNGRLIFEDLVNKMVTNYHGTLGEDIIHKEFIAKDIVVGSGKTAECGDRVHITYTVKHSSDKDSTSQKELKKEIFIGDAVLNKSLENALIGIKEKGQRKIMFNDEKTSANNMATNKKDFLLADVTLEKVSRKNMTTIDWGIFIDKNSFSLIGPKIMCGDNITTYYRIINLQGKQVYNSKDHKKTISFKIGDRKTPNKISSGLMGMVKNESKISLIMNKKEFTYRDKNGTNLIPQNIQSRDLLIIELDTKV